MDNDRSFQFTYSAEQQEEIMAIRKKYLPKQEDKMEQLRKLHHSATQKANAWSIGVGIIGVLFLGTGMSLIMTDLGTILGIINSFGYGLMVGLCGLILVASAYPIFNLVLKKERNRIAPEILKLTEELLK
ncbi:MAG: hypothetical protein IJN20_04705 [Oscillospiraceae bacterium]|nr:hypothetical protein [Oscillospiraceae bacterium]